MSNDGKPLDAAAALKSIAEFDIGDGADEFVTHLAKTTNLSGEQENLVMIGYMAGALRQALIAQFAISGLLGKEIEDVTPAEVQKALNIDSLLPNRLTP